MERWGLVKQTPRGNMRKMRNTTTRDKPRAYGLRRRWWFWPLAVVLGLGVLNAGAGWILPATPPPDDNVAFDAVRHSELFAPDPLLFWRLRPQARVPAEDITINRHGLRGEDLETKRPGVCRIVCLGDSATFGFKVRGHETYPRLLADDLSREFRVEVINGGVPGFSTLQGLRFLRRDILPLQPDLLIISYGLNDVLTAQRADRDRPTYFAPWFAIRGFVLRQNVSMLIARAIGPSERLTKETARRCTLADSLANLNAMYDAAEKQGVRTLFFHPLHAGAPDMRLPSFTLPDRLPALDVAARWIQAGPASDDLFLVDQCHPTAKGYVRLAAIIADHLRGSGWPACRQ
jgi:lysophospholipase L1-like esterase